ncbi:hypothetical protein [Azospirillum sp. TSO22-1]|uniref:hypothetical protein n=1 Tax=Azospirillum sp. TSO22-1 TaxID=716789 RepID=UPI000D64E197|nr:hypothetical protein [Azospirillum sp. TSO22-1]
MSLRIAQVVAVHPSRRRVDLVFLDDGYRAANVLVATGGASSDAGSWNVPNVPRPASEAEAGGYNHSGRTMLALVGFVDGGPVVVGWVPPLSGEMEFTEQNREVHRHPSGTWWTIAPDGSVEVHHNGGAYLRIGSGDHEDLGGVAAGGWSPPGGAPARITLHTDGFTLTVLPGGTVTMEADASVTVKTPSVTIDSPQSLFTGAVTVQGAFTYQGGMTGSGGAKSAAITGDVQVTGGDVKADGVGLKSHTHPDPQGGATAPGVG